MSHVSLGKRTFDMMMSVGYSASSGLDAELMEDERDDFDVDLSSSARLLAKLSSSLLLDMAAECVPVCSAACWGR